MKYLLRELLDDLVQALLAGAIILGALAYLASLVGCGGSDGGTGISGPVDPDPIEVQFEVSLSARPEAACVATLTWTPTSGSAGSVTEAQAGSPEMGAVLVAAQGVAYQVVVSVSCPGPLAGIGAGYVYVAGVREPQLVRCETPAAVPAGRSDSAIWVVG